MVKKETFCFNMDNTVPHNEPAENKMRLFLGAFNTCQRWKSPSMFQSRYLQLLKIRRPQLVMRSSNLKCSIPVPWSFQAVTRFHDMPFPETKYVCTGAFRRKNDGRMGKKSFFGGCFRGHVPAVSQSHLLNSDQLQLLLVSYDEMEKSPLNTKGHSCWTWHLDPPCQAGSIARAAEREQLKAKATSAAQRGKRSSCLGETFFFFQG